MPRIEEQFYTNNWMTSTEQWVLRFRRPVLGVAWMGYMLLVIFGYPYYGVSVMLPSILLCGFAAWLFTIRIGLLIAGLTHPYHIIVMMYYSDNPQAWKGALEPGGLIAQILVVFYISMSKNNRNKSLKLNAEIKKQIRARREELQEIVNFMENMAETEYERMSEQLCKLVDHQLTELLYQSKALRDSLTSTSAPHTEKAIKLVAIAKQNIEQVKILRGKLSAKNIQESGIEQAIQTMCADLSDTVGTKFSISIKELNKDVPKSTHIIYRIIHEAVTNALKHGKATHIEIQLEIDTQIFDLSVCNNGLPLKNLNSDGIGLQLMQQHAESIGATVQYSIDKSNRTVFRCSSTAEANTEHRPFHPTPELLKKRP